MVSTGQKALDGILADGLPERSGSLILGPPGIGKEAICYSFLQHSSSQGYVTIFVSRQSVKDVLEDAKGYGASLERPIVFVDCSGLPVSADAFRCDLSDLNGLSLTLKKLVSENAGRQVRIVIDILSPLLVLYPAQSIYRFLSSLLVELKKFDTVVIATVEDGMHDPRDVVALEQLFDGVIEMRFYEEGLRVLPLLRVRKMRGLAVQPGYFDFRLSSTGGMEISAHTH